VPSAKVERMQTLAAGIAYFDLEFRGRSRIIAGSIIHGPGGVAILDPGPSSTLPVLRQRLNDAGIALRDVTSIVLTHIHLDHAGATGTLVAEHPRLKVFVHERGAPHMIDPAKLIASASQLYGDMMGKLWGEILPVPPAALVSLTGGETVEAGGRRFEVAYTPGHASHHVSYFDPGSGVAFVGDTAGVRITPTGFIMPPTPPPDIDLEIWQTSLETIARWNAQTLVITHFGHTNTPSLHLTELRDHLELVGRVSKTSLLVDGDDAAKSQWFVDEMRREVRQRVGDADAASYEVAGRFDLNWRGLARYWKKKSTS
jgi:glyoxylase-like metal-dependent hydrolase (beta-lactamase superfamily II)